MARSLCLLVLLFISTFAYGQMVENELFGSWKVKQVLKKSTNPELRGVMDGFGKATFTFGENGNFQLVTESKAPTFKMILQLMGNARWRFESEEQLIQIGGEEDGYTLMGIYPRKKEGVLQFALEDSAIVLEMVKTR